MSLKQLIFLFLYPNFSTFFIVITIAVISVSLNIFSSRRVLISVTPVLIVSVLINTIHTYKFWTYMSWELPNDELVEALHGFLSQFSLVGGLIYITAYEL